MKIRVVTTTEVLDASGHLVVMVTSEHHKHEQDNPRFWPEQADDAVSVGSSVHTRMVRAALGGH